MQQECRFQNRDSEEFTHLHMSCNKNKQNCLQLSISTQPEPIFIAIQYLWAINPRHSAGKTDGLTHGGIKINYLIYCVLQTTKNFSTVGKFIHKFIGSPFIFILTQMHMDPKSFWVCLFCFFIQNFSLFSVSISLSPTDTHTSIFVRFFKAIIYFLGPYRDCHKNNVLALI